MERTGEHCHDARQAASLHPGVDPNALPDYDVIERAHYYKARDHGYEIVHSRYSTPAKELVYEPC
jgi:hypothetical protein